jgi:hypothetical protein
MSLWQRYPHPPSPVFCPPSPVSCPLSPVPSKKPFGKNSPPKIPLFSRNTPPRSRKIPEKPQNQLVKPEGTIPRSSKNARKQTFFAPPANRIFNAIGNISGIDRKAKDAFARSSSFRDSRPAAAQSRKIMRIAAANPTDALEKLLPSSIISRFGATVLADPIAKISELPHIP